MIELTREELNMFQGLTEEQQTAYIKGYGRDFAEIFNYPAAVIEAEGFAFNKNNRYLQGDNPTSEDR